MVKTIDEVLKLTNEYVYEANRFFYIKEAYLFGSYAKGTPNEYSDIDVALVSPDFKYIPTDMSLKLLFRLAGTISTYIEPVVLTEEEIKHPLPGSIAYDIAKEGKKIQ
ncbi:MAG: nucleotidyltransferase domain-containing protein [Oligoflexia bacterium]|nr:nucleotidyltransferase domain-containing protein [Oligoflexia bacterium]